MADYYYPWGGEEVLSSWVENSLDLSGQPDHLRLKNGNFGLKSARDDAIYEEIWGHSE
jgi:hypothetical protein